jgi:hypothetical protein
MKVKHLIKLPLPKPLPLGGRGFSKIAHDYSKTNAMNHHYLNYNFIVKPDLPLQLRGRGRGGAFYRIE